MLNLGHRLVRVRHQRGITLIESLVALTVLAVGVLGVLGVQLRTLADAQATARRAQAIQLIDDLAERIRSNPQRDGAPAMAAYLGGFDARPVAATRCDDRPCNPVELAAWDIADWRDALAETLPDGRAAVFALPEEAAGTPGAAPRQLGVVLGWRPVGRRHANDPGAAEGAAQAAALRAPFAIDTGRAQVECPKGLLCHVGYVQP